MKYIMGAARRARRGNATVVGLITVLMMAGMSGAVLAITMRSQSERSAAVERHRALDNAKSGIAHVVANLTAGDDSSLLGSFDAPVEFGEGHYYATVVENGDGTYTVTSTGVSLGEMEAVEVVLAPVSESIYDNAVFAGNSGEDPDYTMDFGGEDDQRDEIRGDIYSGGNIAVIGDAELSGSVRATGDITGVAGEEDVILYPPDLAAMDYENSADFDVLDLFLTGGYTYEPDAAGGWAFQTSEDNPAHIFRINPSDRSSLNNATPKLDYYLEDPYETVTSDSGMDGSDAYEISLSGISGEPGPNGNNVVYFLDGNLWIHNLRTFSMKIEHAEANGVQVTFVAKGNIYISDNLFLENEQLDGIALIAMNDSDHQDSGNIYFGDPTFGTLENMAAFMYAENNFYDTNLPAQGSEVVQVSGNMTAGNQVAIDRDWITHHTKLIVAFDDRISAGDLEMPGLPLTLGGGVNGYTVLSWRQVPVQ